MADDKSRYLKKLDQLVKAFVPRSGAHPQQSQQTVSDELDHLLWQFAEDGLSEEEEERLWELAAKEPGAVQYFASMLASLERHDSPELSVLPDAVVRRLQTQISPSISPGLLAGFDLIKQQAAALQGFIADISLQVSREFLQVAHGIGTLSRSLARSSDERRTSHTHQLLRRVGIIEIVIDHAGEQRCHLTIRVTEPSDSYPLTALQARLFDPSGIQPNPVALSGGFARFSDLATGNYAIAIEKDGQEIERIAVSLLLDITQ